MTHVANGKWHSRLDIDETINELPQECECWENTPANWPQFSMRDGISWVGSRLNICKIQGDEKVHQDQMDATNREVNVGVGATFFAQCTNCSLVIGVNKEVGIP